MIRFHLVGQTGARHSQTWQLHSFSGKGESKMAEKSISNVLALRCGVLGLPLGSQA